MVWAFWHVRAAGQVVARTTIAHLDDVVRAATEADLGSTVRQLLQRPATRPRLLAELMRTIFEQLTYAVTIAMPCVREHTLANWGHGTGVQTNVGRPLARPDPPIHAAACHLGPSPGWRALTTNRRSAL
jgi:hypothetical protein